MPKRRSDFLYQLDEDFLRCRVFGHHWGPVGNFMNGKEVHAVLQCATCDSYAVVQWAKGAGTINGRKPKYTPGYLNNSGEHVTRADARVEYIRRSNFGTSAQFEKLMDRLDRERDSYR